MKALKFMMAAGLVCSMAACQSDYTSLEDELNPGLDETTGGTTAFYAPEFPAPDGSRDLSTKQWHIALRDILKATDPSRATDWKNLEITQEQFDKIKAQADALCDGLTSDLKKIETLQKWVNTNVKYTEGKNNNAYTVFQNKQGVCQGYANLFKAMALSQGIPCAIVNGFLVQWPDAPVDFNPGHAWNYAYAEGKGWYVCDPTNSNTPIIATSTSNYATLQPNMIDFVLFEDDVFEYDFLYGHLNIHSVKKGMNDLVLPFGVSGLQVTSFNPVKALPTSVQRIYMGANIKTLGTSYTIIGLKAYPSFDEEIFIDPTNKTLGSEYGVVYYKDNKGELSDIYYIPQMMSTITLRPMEKVEKNTIYSQPGVREIIFLEGTKTLEPYAIEDCENLETVWVPEDCTIMDDAIYKCPANVQIQRGIPTGIKPIRK